MFGAKTSTVLQASRHHHHIRVSSGGCGNFRLMQDVDFGSDVTVDVKKQKQHKIAKTKTVLWQIEVNTCGRNGERCGDTSLFRCFCLPSSTRRPLCRQRASRVASVCETPEWLHGFEKSHRSLNRHSVELKMGLGWTMALKCKTSLKWERRRRRKKHQPHNANCFFAARSKAKLC